MPVTPAISAAVIAATMSAGSHNIPAMGIQVPVVADGYVVCKMPLNDVCKTEIEKPGLNDWKPLSWKEFAEYKMGYSIDLIGISYFLHNGDNVVVYFKRKNGD